MKVFSKITAVVLLAFASQFESGAQLRLASVFGDHMVLQQKSNAAIWGWGYPGAIVAVTGSWNTDTVKVKVGNDARWTVNLPVPSAGGPFTLTIASEKKITLQNVMAGEVWVCSGQSNMEWSASKKIMNAEEEVKNANYPDIRFFNVNRAASANPQDNCQGTWEVCTPASMTHFSAVAYFFGRHLQQYTNVPVGLINASWGGTPAEVWVRSDLVKNDPLLNNSAQKLKRYDWWPKEPGTVYNAMIAPLAPLNIAGVLWYQGEGNTDNYESYRALLKTLIESWRSDFRKEFPFYYVQIAPYTYGENTKAMMLREAQAQCQDVPKTGMVVVSDLVDNVRDIHPLNKQDVGKRLANFALAEVYGVKGLNYKFPQYRSHTVEKNRIRVEFSGSGSGFSLNQGSKPVTFEIAGEDKVFVPAEAKIEGNSIVVWSREVVKPVAVRYSFKNDAIGNVVSKEGLPLAPFRTDNW